MTATLALVVHSTLRARVSRALTGARYLRQARINHESFLCRAGRCVPSYVHVSRNQAGRLAVVFNTGPLSSVVTFGA
jgi:hypothetical protein